jgi:hypothetical protein
MTTPGKMLSDFFDSYRLHRADDRITSIEAAEAIAPKIGKIQKLVLDFAEGKRAFGFTDIDLNTFFNSTSSTYRSRRAELTEIGLIVDTGMFRMVNGKRHTIWVHKDYEQ